jgi:hypothetical protein
MARSTRRTRRGVTRLTVEILGCTGDLIGDALNLRLRVSQTLPRPSWIFPVAFLAVPIALSSFMTLSC